MNAAKGDATKLISSAIIAAVDGLEKGNAIAIGKRHSHIRALIFAAIGRCVGLSD